MPPGACYFRKEFVSETPERGEILIVADDAYELYVNGRHVANGTSHGTLAKHSISPFLSRGRNLVAVKVNNLEGTTAAVAARIDIKAYGGSWQSISTDETWKTHLRPLPFWNTSVYNDRRWAAAQTLGVVATTDTPEGDTPEREPEESDSPSDVPTLQIADEFRVESLLDGVESGPLVAMTFDEFGHVLAARADGPLLLIYDSDEDDRPDAMRVYCDQVRDCQGILALNGEVFVTGDGPQGHALYRLSDQDGDGTLEQVRALVTFRKAAAGTASMAWPWAPMACSTCRSGTSLKPKCRQSPPVLTTMRTREIWSSRGTRIHAVKRGVKAPAGVVLRTDIEGQVVQFFAGGLHNAHDLAFNGEGELFVYDTTMYVDEGDAWYRPSRLYHLTAGAECGWRSGWAKSPEYVNALPGLDTMGNGTPTGAVFYEHFAFPSRFHNALFVGDVTGERILVHKLKRAGASYEAASEVFLQGRPLRITDLDVAPDGSLYFTTGGHATEGGLFRISWQGDIPKAVADLGEGMTAAIRQPQLQSTGVGRRSLASGTNWATPGPRS